LTRETPKPQRSKNVMEGSKGNIVFSGYGNNAQIEESRMEVASYRERHYDNGHWMSWILK